LKKRLDIRDFKELKIKIDDTWNKVEKGETWIYYYDKNFDTSKLDIDTIKNRDDIQEICYKNCIGYINYRTRTGQIGLFFINKHYQNRGLGKQILNKVIIDLKEHNNKTVWTITSVEHPFWSNVYNKSFEYKRRPHTSVTGDGYLLNLNKFSIQQ